MDLWNGRSHQNSLDLLKFSMKIIAFCSPPHSSQMTLSTQPGTLNPSERRAKGDDGASVNSASSGFESLPRKKCPKPAAPAGTHFYLCTYKDFLYVILFQLTRHLSKKNSLLVIRETPLKLVSSRRRRVTAAAICPIRDNLARSLVMCDDRAPTCRQRRS